ncbi:hypothetical protein [Streptomyces coeruleorubidus]|uniref:hypothetical protein n=1 Tax=Streptomyces coeruleorubidus TaxID=116188 RepID=UPI0033A3AE6D
MTGRDARPAHGQVALDDVQVGAAHPAGEHTLQQLVVRGHRHTEGPRPVCDGTTGSARGPARG